MSQRPRWSSCHAERRGITLKAEKHMYRAIMVPLSDWRTDSRAVSAAVQLARRSAARLHIVHVRKGAWTRAAGRAEDQALDAAVGWAGDELNESVSFRMIRSELKGRRGGRTAEELTEYALANDIELTVMTRSEERRVGKETRADRL